MKKKFIALITIIVFCGLIVSALFYFGEQQLTEKKRIEGFQREMDEVEYEYYSALSENLELIKELEPEAVLAWYKDHQYTDQIQMIHASFDHFFAVGERYEVNDLVPDYLRVKQMLQLEQFICASKVLYGDVKSKMSLIAEEVSDEYVIDHIIIQNRDNLRGRLEDPSYPYGEFDMIWCLKESVDTAESFEEIKAMTAAYYADPNIPDLSKEWLKEFIRNKDWNHIKKQVTHDVQHRLI